MSKKLNFNNENNNINTKNARDDCGCVISRLTNFINKYSDTSSGKSKKDDCKCLYTRAINIAKISRKLAVTLPTTARKKFKILSSKAQESIPKIKRALCIDNNAKNKKCCFGKLRIRKKDKHGKKARSKEKKIDKNDKVSEGKKKKPSITEDDDLKYNKNVSSKQELKGKLEKGKVGRDTEKKSKESMQKDIKEGKQAAQTQKPKTKKEKEKAIQKQKEKSKKEQEKAAQAKTKAQKGSKKNKSLMSRCQEKRALRRKYQRLWATTPIPQPTYQEAWAKYGDELNYYRNMHAIYSSVGKKNPATVQRQEEKYLKRITKKSIFMRKGSRLGDRVMLPNDSCKYYKWEGRLLKPCNCLNEECRCPGGKDPRRRVPKDPTPNIVLYPLARCFRCLFKLQPRNPFSQRLERHLEGLYKADEADIGDNRTPSPVFCVLGCRNCAFRRRRFPARRRRYLKEIEVADKIPEEQQKKVEVKKDLKETGDGSSLTKLKDTREVVVEIDENGVPSVGIQTYTDSDGRPLPDRRARVMRARTWQSVFSGFDGDCLELSKGPMIGTSNNFLMRALYSYVDEFKTSFEVKRKQFINSLYDVQETSASVAIQVSYGRFEWIPKCPRPPQCVCPDDDAAIIRDVLNRTISQVCVIANTHMPPVPCKHCPKCSKRFNIMSRISAEKVIDDYARKQMLRAELKSHSKVSNIKTPKGYKTSEAESANAVIKASGLSHFWQVVDKGLSKKDIPGDKAKGAIPTDAPAVKGQTGDGEKRTDEEDKNKLKAADAPQAKDKKKKKNEKSSKDKVPKKRVVVEHIVEPDPVNTHVDECWCEADQLLGQGNYYYKRKKLREPKVAS